MRISTSSSLFLATLAISSSSSSLAAPTEQGALEYSSFPSSSRMYSMATTPRRDIIDSDISHGHSAAGGSHSIATGAQHAHDRRQLDPLLNTLSGLLGPAFDPVLKALAPLLKALGLESAVSASSVENNLNAITPDQIASIKQAILGAAVNIGSCAPTSAVHTPHAQYVAMDAMTSDAGSSSANSSWATSASGSSTLAVMAAPHLLLALRSTRPLSVPVPARQPAEHPVPPPPAPVKAAADAPPLLASSSSASASMTGTASSSTAASTASA
ncbi:hypothetical protein A0H81_01378 [Grifola frondosa]|uniref:Uncharacterized protein n=1 Tax=Grifola frondosa TaxID=5627 RepID=A0A1C7MPR8_GRIFR|nr:hypothetical protein A0H81_01378 [Grifola frondosa]